VLGPALAAVVSIDVVLHRGDRARTRRGPLAGALERNLARGSWLSLPSAPRATSVDDDWVLEAFDTAEIAELHRIDEDVRRELAADTLAQVRSKVPGDRRSRRVRGVGWSDGRLSLILADGTAVELDGVAQDTAVWLAYCHDQFGLLLVDIGPADATWAARVASCGVATPLQASRVRVS
jgi:hypothetical protein